MIQEARLDVAQNDLNAAQAILDEKQRELDVVQAMYDGAMKEKQVGFLVTSKSRTTQHDEIKANLLQSVKMNIQ